jgi:hypothetical protein
MPRENSQTIFPKLVGEMKAELGYWIVGYIEHLASDKVLVTI